LPVVASTYIQPTTTWFAIMGIIQISCPSGILYNVGFLGYAPGSGSHLLKSILLLDRYNRCCCLGWFIPRFEQLMGWQWFDFEVTTYYNIQNKKTIEHRILLLV
jgi:hypothetical protein